ncbi:MAG: glycosyltransferase family 9 protein [Thermoanaerobaculia bacterium]
MRILLIRTSALGDIVHCLPVLTALRRERPEAKIAWVVEEAMAPLLAGHPDLDELIPVRLRPWRKQPFAAATRREVWALIRQLRAFRADVALDLMGNHKAGVLAWLSGAPARIGAQREARREASSSAWINRPVAVAGQHAVDRALSLLAGLGLEPQRADFGPEKILAAGTPESVPLPIDVVIHPGAGWANKVYPPASWGAVARQLAANGFSVGVALARGEEALAQEIETTSGGAARRVEAGSLPALAATLRATRLLLAGDTGPLHLAHALGTPVVAVMGPTDPARHGPYGRPDLALALTLPCSGCYKRLDGPRACLLSLSPEEVAAKALAVLG